MTEEEFLAIERADSQGLTEAEWLAGRVGEALLVEAQRRSASDRKLWLFACACCRRVWNYPVSSAAWEFLDDAGLEFLDAAERVADGTGTASDAVRLEEMGGRWPNVRSPYNFLACIFHARRSRTLYQVRSSVGYIARRDHGSDAAGEAAERAEHAAQAELIRDVIGNPFRPVTFDSAWRTSTVVTLAQLMYDSRDFSAMPILADALQDAGSDSNDILDHCRGPGPHVRGCWVVDVVLGKE